MARIAYLVSNPGVSDARVIKIARAAVEAGHEVHLFGTQGDDNAAYANIDNITYHRFEWRPSDILKKNSLIISTINKMSKKAAGNLTKRVGPFAKYRLFKNIFSQHIAAIKPDIIHSHDLICLPAAAAAAAACDAKLIYDAHELEVHRNPPHPFFQKRFVSYIEWKYGRRADVVITVGRKVREVLASHLRRKDLDIIYNSPAIEPCPHSIRQDLRLHDDTPLLIYVGKVAEGRGVGEIVAILPKLPGVTFAAVGPCDNKTKNLINNQASKLGVANRFRILPPVPFAQVVNYIKSANLGIISVEPVTLSYKYCMPNKLFEMAFANVPIISNELDEIRDFLDENRNGKIVDFENKTTLVYTISRMLIESTSFYMNEEQLQKLESKYSWKNQIEKLLHIYIQLGESSNARNQ